mgnify:CR=1 FL=1
MAYGGGYLVKPVVSENGSISELFLAGQAQVTAVRDKVREERRVQNEVLGKATEFEATGIQDMDNFWASAGSQARAQMMADQQANRDGTMSRAEVTRNAARISGEMKMVGQLPIIIKEQRDAIIKKQESEGYSGLTLAEFDRTWFKAIGTGAYAKPVFTAAQDAIPAVPEVIATPADISGGALDINGKPAVAGSVMKEGVPKVDAKAATRIQLKQNYSPELIDGKQFMRFTYEQIDQDNKITVRSIIKPLSEHVNPSKVKYFKVDDKKSVKEFTSNIGKQGMTITGPNGLQQPLFSNMQVTDNGTTIMGRIANEKDVNTIAKAIEQEITSKPDDWIASYAFDILGARDPFADGATGIPLTKAEVDQKFPGSIYFNYDAATKTGTPITFEGDPLLFDMDEKGNTVVTQDTRDLVMAHYRNQLMAGMNVSTEVYKDRAKAAASGRKTVDKTFKASPVNYSLNGVATRTDSPNFTDRIRLAQMNKNFVNEVKVNNVALSQNDIDNANSAMAVNGRLGASTVAIPSVLSKLTSTQYDQTTQGAVSLGGMMDKLKDVLNVSTFTNNEFQNITGFYTAQNVNGQAVVVLTGDALYGEVSTQNQGSGGQNDITKKTGTGQFLSEGFSNPLTDKQTQNFYEKMFDKINGSPEMRGVLATGGFYEEHAIEKDLQGNETKVLLNYKAALHYAQDYINRNATL